ncbi:MAG TPA: translation initiation factor IF-3 [Micropepsaceae bacterium]|nr:translation initiation factor IF-3 [Micropepsaceae bacterium]
MRRPASAAPPPKRERDEDGPRVNEEITAWEVLVIDDAGEKRGQMTRAEALKLADEEGYDLVEVAPQAKPPVCRLMDYGKFKYEQQKKAAEARKNQKIIEIKELKMRPMIDEHDYEVKLRAARRFFEEGDKVKFTLRFRGREMQHQHLGYELIERIRKELEPIAKVEQEARLEGKQMQMVMAPK